MARPGQTAIHGAWPRKVRAVLSMLPQDGAGGCCPNPRKESEASAMIAAAIIAEAALSFLGLGQQPPAPSWGSMLNAAQRFLTHAPWMAIWPGLAIFLVVLSLNLLGDGLRDALDPRLRGR